MEDTDRFHFVRVCRIPRAIVPQIVAARSECGKRRRYPRWKCMRGVMAATPPKSVQSPDDTNPDRAQATAGATGDTWA